MKTTIIQLKPNSNYKLAASIRKVICHCLCLLVLQATLHAASITIVVEPERGRGAQDRAAHFNWNFESSSGAEVRTGQYACGSYWIAPAVGESSVRLLSLTGKAGQNDLLSLDADPLPFSHGLVGDNKTYGSYNAAENDLPNLPMLYTPAADSAISLVAAMQRNEAETGGAGTSAIRGGAVDAYCFVTVLPAPPPENGINSIRPNIVGDVKQFLTWDDFNLNVLPRHSFLGTHTEFLNRPQVAWNHSTEIFSMKYGQYNNALGYYEYASYSEGGRAFRAHILHSDYAAGATSTMGETLMRLMGDDSLDVKKRHLASVIAHGHDILHARFGMQANPGAWNSGAGQWGGQFNTPAFVGSLMKDKAFAIKLRKAIVDNYTQPNSNLRGPQEMRQIMRGQTGVLLWGLHNPLRVNEEPTAELEQEFDRRYWADLGRSNCYNGALGTCDTRPGKRTMSDPYGYIDGPPGRPGSSYFSVTTGGFRLFAALMILFPEFGHVANSPEVIEYADRISSFGIWSYPDPVAPASAADQQNGCGTWRASDGLNCVDFREAGGWGPSQSDRRYAIENGVGRFALDIHGSSVDLSYTTDLVRANWDAIIARYQGATFEDKVVPLGTVVAPDIHFFNDETGQAFAHVRCATFDATIHYEIGTNVESTPSPTTSSAIYTDFIPVGIGQVIRAYAVKEGLISSAVSNQQLLWDPQIIPDETPPSISNITVSSITSSSAVITWFTDEPASSFIDYGPTTAYGATASTLGFSTSHSVTVANLAGQTTFNFQVRSADGSGNLTTSANATFTTLAPDIIAPTCSINAPANGATLNGQVDLTATATDNNTVALVEFFLNGNRIGTASTSDATTFILSWNSRTVPNGTYTLQAIATDAEGNQGSSTTLSLTVDNPLPDLADGLISYWSFDEGSGNTAFDTIGNHNATVHGATWVQGQTTGALDFDGSDDYVVAGPVPLSGTAMTIALWFKADDFGIADARLISQADGTTDSAHHYMLSTVASGGTKLRCRLKVNGSTTTLIASTGNLQTDVWMHAAAVYDGTALTLYLDGQNVGSTPLSGAITSNTTLNTHIGSNSPNDKYFDGAIDAVRIYNRALNAIELQTLIDGEDTQNDDTTPPVISAIQVSNISDTSALISWTTDELATSQVNYGTSNTYGQSSVLNTQLTTQHSVTLNNLTANTSYHFQALSADSSNNTVRSNDQTFMTNATPVEGVTSFTLIDADTDLAVAEHDPIVNGATINLNTLGLSNINIRANTAGNITRIFFELSGTESRTHSEGASPYALFIDNPTGDYLPWVPADGAYTLSANDNGGPDTTIGFTITRDNESGYTYTDFQTTHNIGSPTDDDDQDQLPNLYEYFAGLDPTATDAMDTVLWMEADAATASFNFMSPVDGRADLIVQIQKSTDMTTWETIAEREGSNAWTNPTALTRTLDNDGMEHVQVSEPFNNNNTRCFYRLRLTRE